VLIHFKTLSRQFEIYSVVYVIFPPFFEKDAQLYDTLFVSVGMKWKEIGQKY